MKVAEPRPHHPSPFAGRGAALLVALALPSLCGVAVAQQATLTGGMLRTPPAAVPAKTRAATPPPPAPAPRRAATPSPPPEQVGDATQALLRMQVDGAQAAPALPMLGDEANAAYRRYLQSFTHPIPEFFPAHVRDARDDSR